MIRKTHFLGLLALAACGTTSNEGRAPRSADAAPASTRIATPLTLDGTAYEAASRVQLPDVQPIETHGLHRVYKLSDRIISGAEPETPASLEEIAGMGVKTILSVDGKAPDVAGAEKLGLRYVHIPIRYKEITREEQMRIAKTFRELEGPFYVHCYHGQHRGPAAAAIGRVLVDGAAREQALAEMRQWCGTSEKYEGLYGVIAVSDLPTADETSAYDFDFPSAHKFDGIRHAMVDMARSWDVIKDQRTRDWLPNPNHPDASALNESKKLLEAFVQLENLEGAEDEPSDYRTWMANSVRQSRELASFLELVQAGDKTAGKKAFDASIALGKSCADCHAEYRN